MRKRILSLILALCMVLSLLPATVFAAQAENTETEEDLVTVLVGGREEYSESQRFLEELNKYRKDKGLAPLTLNATLTELAMQRASEYPVNQSSTTRPDGSQAASIVDGVYDDWTVFGEYAKITKTHSIHLINDMATSVAKDWVYNEEITHVGIGSLEISTGWSDKACVVFLFGNSTTNTETTDQSDVVTSRREVRVNPDDLTGMLGGKHRVIRTTPDDEAYVGGLYHKPGSYQLTLLPITTDAVNRKGEVIATLSYADESPYSVKITPVRHGIGELVLPLYEGQSDPLRVTIIVDNGVDPLVSPDPEAEDSGTWGDNITWKLEGTTLTISGEGEADYLTDLEPLYPWTYYMDAVTDVVVEEGVTSLSKGFQDFSALERVYLADSLKRFSYCFQNCPELREIRFPAGMTDIDSCAFEGSGIEEIVIPDGVTEIGYAAFKNCSNLKKITLPDGLTYIDQNAFMNTGLTEIHLPDTVTEISVGAFMGCTKLKTVDIPTGLKRISSEAFRETAIETMVLPEGLEFIGNWAFNDCDNLEFVSIPGVDTQVDFYAFLHCDKVVVSCRAFTQAHMAARKCGVSCNILEEPKGTKVYPIYIYHNPGGTVEIAAQTVAAGRKVWFNMMPEQDCVVAAVYYQTEDGSELKELRLVGTTAVEFIMPDCAVAFEVVFFRAKLPFVDVKESAYYYLPVLWAVNAGITAGTDETHFSPDNRCTRAQVVTFLWRAAGCPEPTITENPFVDVKEDTYYYKAVLWAVENGITAGVDATHFGPEQSCTRGQVVTFLWRACGKPEVESREHPFTDIKETAFYYDAVLWAVENGITAGVSQKSFAPDMSCTRGQIVSFLYRTLAE